MGRGDIKTKRGKIAAGSFGKSRSAKIAKVAPKAASEETAAPAKAEKKAPAKKAK